MDMKVTDLEMRQVEREETALGTLRFRDALQPAHGGPTSTTQGLRLVQRAAQLMIPVIEAYLKDALLDGGGGSRDIGAAYVVQEFEPKELATITSIRCLQAIAAPRPLRLQQVAMDLARHLDSARVLQKPGKDASKEEKKLYGKLEKELAKASRTSSRAILLREYQETARVVSIEWTDKERCRAGVKLINLFIEATGWATAPTLSEPSEYGKPQKGVRLRPTPAAEGLLDKEQVIPRHEPMIAPPRDWTSPHGGGYLTEQMRLDVVKRANRNYLEDLYHTADLSGVYGVYDAINALQRTPWAINEGVYGVMEQAWRSGQLAELLPTQEETALPEKPHDIDTNEEALKGWKQDAAEVHTANDDTRAARATTRNALHAAKDLRQHARFYFVHTMDFTGRVYPISDHLQPQGNDLMRGLLRFADGVPLGADGARWLAIHGANCYGIDKVSFEERVEWVQEHQQKIIDSAIDPLTECEWWTAADKPWQFLAFAREWAGLVLWTNAGKPQEEYVSYLPVGLDGTCNGLQHYSMLLRDEVGGAATNLIPSEKPADIYGQVAVKADALLADDRDAGRSKFAKVWAGKVTRKIAKKAAMTKPYGVTLHGIRDELWDAIGPVKSSPLARVAKKEHGKAVHYLAETIEEAVNRVIDKASEAMDWLRDVAGVAAEHGQPFGWRVPSTFIVRQEYMKPRSKRVTCWIENRPVKLTLVDAGSKLDTKQTKTATAANYIHSLDAAHLVRTIGYCLGRGVEAFAVVHDSYATHAGKLSILDKELRQAFVDQYQGDVLGQFRADILEQVHDKALREKIIALTVPEPGKLDPAKVLESEYFFS